MKKAIVIFTTIFAIMIMMMGCAPVTNTLPISIQSEPKPEPLLRFIDETGTREWKVISIEKEHNRGIFEEGPIGKNPEFQGNFNYNETPWSGSGDYENDGFRFKGSAFVSIGVNNNSTKFVNPDKIGGDGKCITVTAYTGNVKNQFRKLFGLSL